MSGFGVHEVIVSRGPWPAAGRADAIELLFDDGTAAPLAVQMGTEQIDRLPRDEDQAGRWVSTV